MKIALCFIISHFLHKEELWKKWIELNKDLINVYFFYKNKKLIQSQWILDHCLPERYIYPTSYFYIVPAYFSLFKYALQNNDNIWFCMLTESCVPIVSPKALRYFFENYYNKSILEWKMANWNVQFHKRANLRYLPPSFHLCNTPWFIFTRKHVELSFEFVKKQPKMFQIVSKGIIANESIFAIILLYFNELKYVIKQNSTIMDWTRMSSVTSPYVFKNSSDFKSILELKQKNKYGIFLRKVFFSFPDQLLENLTLPPISTIDTSNKSSHGLIS